MRQSVCKIYLQKQKEQSFTENIPVSEKTDLIVVIPCYNEPDAEKTLLDLFSCEKEDFCTEVLLIINSYCISSQEAKELNRKTYMNALELASVYNDEYIRLIPFIIKDLPGRQTGAGLPRKIGMDEALRRFLSVGKEDGVIVSLDADCRIEKNYLKEIHKTFKKDKKLLSATIAFHHPVKHLPEDNVIRQSMELYELYLHYYRNALAYTGYPYAYHTVGSAFAVRCLPYAQVGGMGKQQAGEDFYFLQKIFPLGKTQEINATYVYPAARLSDRVPFGTGPALVKMISADHIVKYTYSFQSFCVLKELFDHIDKIYESSREDMEGLINRFSPMLFEFLLNDGFLFEVDVIKQTTSSLPAFRKRFFNYFNAFKILKFLNFVHPEYLELKEVREEVAKLKREYFSYK